MPFPLYPIERLWGDFVLEKIAHTLARFFALKSRKNCSKPGLEWSQHLIFSFWLETSELALVFSSLFTFFFSWNFHLDFVYTKVFSLLEVVSCEWMKATFWLAVVRNSSEDKTDLKMQNGSKDEMPFCKEIISCFYTINTWLSELLG